MERPCDPCGGVRRLAQQAVELAGAADRVDHQRDVLLAPAHQQGAYLEAAQGAAAGDGPIAEVGAPREDAVPVGARHHPGRGGLDGVGGLRHRPGLEQARDGVLVQALGREGPSVPGQQDGHLVGMLGAQPLPQVLPEPRVVAQAVRLARSGELLLAQAREQLGGVVAARQRAQAGRRHQSQERAAQHDTAHARRHLVQDLAAEIGEERVVGRPIGCRLPGVAHGVEHDPCRPAARPLRQAAGVAAEAAGGEQRRDLVLAEREFRRRHHAGPPRQQVARQVQVDAAPRDQHQQYARRQGVDEGVQHPQHRGARVHLVEVVDHDGAPGRQLLRDGGRAVRRAEAVAQQAQRGRRQRGVERLDRGGQVHHQAARRVIALPQGQPRGAAGSVRDELRHRRRLTRSRRCRDQQHAASGCGPLQRIAHPRAVDRPVGGRHTHLRLDQPGRASGHEDLLPPVDASGTA